MFNSNLNQTVVCLWWTYMQQLNITLTSTCKYQKHSATYLINIFTITSQNVGNCWKFYNSVQCWLQQIYISRKRQIKTSFKISTETELYCNILTHRCQISGLHKYSCLTQKAIIKTSDWQQERQMFLCTQLKCVAQLAYLCE